MSAITNTSVYLNKATVVVDTIQNLDGNKKVSKIMWNYTTALAVAKDYENVPGTYWLKRTFITAPVGIVKVILRLVICDIAYRILALPFNGVGWKDSFWQLLYCLARDVCELRGYLTLPFCRYGFHLIEHNRLQRQWVLEAPHSPEKLVEKFVEMLIDQDKMSMEILTHLVEKNNKNTEEKNLERALQCFFNKPPTQLLKLLGDLGEDNLFFSNAKVIDCLKALPLAISKLYAEKKRIPLKFPKETIEAINNVLSNFKKEDHPIAEAFNKLLLDVQDYEGYIEVRQKQINKNFPWGDLFNDFDLKFKDQELKDKMVWLYNKTKALAPANSTQIEPEILRCLFLCLFVIGKGEFLTKELTNLTLSLKYHLSSSSEKKIKICLQILELCKTKIGSDNLPIIDNVPIVKLCVQELLKDKPTYERLDQARKVAATTDKDWNSENLILLAILNNLKTENAVLNICKLQSLYESTMDFLPIKIESRKSFALGLIEKGEGVDCHDQIFEICANLLTFESNGSVDKVKSEEAKKAVGEICQKLLDSMSKEGFKDTKELKKIIDLVGKITPTQVLIDSLFDAVATKDFNEGEVILSNIYKDCEFQNKILAYKKVKLEVENVKDEISIVNLDKIYESLFAIGKGKFFEKELKLLDPVLTRHLLKKNSKEEEEKCLKLLDLYNKAKIDNPVSAIESVKELVKGAPNLDNLERAEKIVFKTKDYDSHMLIVQAILEKLKTTDDEEEIVALKYIYLRIVNDRLMFKINNRKNLASALIDKKISACYQMAGEICISFHEDTKEKDGLINAKAAVREISNKLMNLIKDGNQKDVELNKAFVKVAIDILTPKEKNLDENLNKDLIEALKGAYTLLKEEIKNVTIDTDLSDFSLLYGALLVIGQGEIFDNDLPPLKLILEKLLCEEFSEQKIVICLDILKKYNESAKIIIVKECVQTLIKDVPSIEKLSQARLIAQTTVIDSSSDRLILDAILKKLESEETEVNIEELKNIFLSIVSYFRGKIKERESLALALIKKSTEVCYKNALSICTLMINSIDDKDNKIENVKLSVKEIQNAFVKEIKEGKLKDVSQIKTMVEYISKTFLEVDPKQKNSLVVKELFETLASRIFLECKEAKNQEACTDLLKLCVQSQCNGKFVEYKEQWEEISNK